MISMPTKRTVPFFNFLIIFWVGMLASFCSVSLSSYHSPSSLSGGYPGAAGDDMDFRSLASTLEKLYAWEKKLYKEVKVYLLYNFCFSSFSIKCFLVKQIVLFLLLPFCLCQLILHGCIQDSNLSGRSRKHKDVNNV